MEKASKKLITEFIKNFISCKMQIRNARYALDYPNFIGIKL